MDPQQGKADIAPDPNTRISMEEYLDLAMNLNDMSMKSFLMDKINLFSRPGLREYMRRPALEIASASDEEIRQFLQTFGKVTGKCNSSAGKGFRIYTDGEEGSGEDIVARIRADGADIAPVQAASVRTAKRTWPRGSVQTALTSWSPFSVSTPHIRRSIRTASTHFAFIPCAPAGKCGSSCQSCCRPEATGL